MQKITDDLWVIYKNRIPVDKVKIAIEVSKMNPLGLKYKRWWKRQKRRCIEGYWAEHNSEFKYVSGPLYTYVNFWRIKLTAKNSRSKGKTLGIPFLRDLEWLRSFVADEAKGFSGFDDDDETTSFKL
jgi:hypothetical protein